jgi:hypothetical protein
MDAFQDYFTSFVPFPEEKLCALYGLCNLTQAQCCALEPRKAQYCCPGLGYNATLDTPYKYNSSNIVYFSSKGPAGNFR